MLKRLRASALAALALVAALSLATVQAASTLSSTRITFGFGGGMAGGPALGTTTFSLAESWSYPLTNGSGANNASKIYVATAAVTTTVDLDSTLTFADGSTGSFSRIVAVGIKPGASNAANLALSGDFILTKYLTPGGDTLANVSIPIHKTGGFSFVAPDATGVAVTATTGDGLTITVSGSDSFSLVVIGS
jgi:hypothetical protein